MTWSPVRIIAIAAALAAIMAFAPSVRQARTQTPTPVQYRLSPEVRDGLLVGLRVEMRFTGDEDGETRVLLPDEYGGDTAFWRAIHDLEMTGGTAVPGQSGTERLIHHGPGEMLSVTYVVKDDRLGMPPPDNTTPYHAMIGPTHFHSTGYALFASPEGRADAPVSLSTDQSGGVSVFSSLGAGSAFTLNDIASLRHQLFIGGDYDVHEMPVENADFRIALRGERKVESALTVAAISRLVMRQFGFWREPPSDMLVVINTLPVEGTRDAGGSAFSNSFTTFSPWDFGEQSLSMLIAHELFHRWNPGRLGGQGGSANVTKGMWFNEGFTSYYTHRLAARSAITSADDLIARWNNLLDRYAASPIVSISNAEIVRLRDAGDPGIGQFPYDRGMLFAALVDYRIRRESRGTASLDDLMVSLRVTEGQAPPPLAHLRLADSDEGRFDLASLVDKHIVNGDRILLEADTFAPCADIQTEVIAVFDAGFDGSATRANNDTIVGVRVDGPAWRAGMRDGMQIIERRHTNVRTSRDTLIYEVRDESGQRTITYLPEGDRRYTQQTIVRRPNASEEVCLTSLGG